jgi:membrane fusion protein (multidrug efflux system)
MNKTVREVPFSIDDPELPSKGSIRRRLLIAVLLIVVVAGGAWYGRYWFIVGRWQEVTDDAYVGGDTTSLSPQVPGYIAEIRVEDNQKVAKGQVLARIDDRTYRAAVDHAKASVRQQQAALDNLHARRDLQGLAVQQAEADVDVKAAAATFAGQEVNRYQALAQTNAGSKQNAQKAESADLQAKSSVLGSRAALAAAQQQIKVLDTQIGQAEAAIAAARADLETATLNLGYTQIVSPIDGYVGNRAVRVGSYVAAGAYLLSIVPSKGLWVDANFKEDQLRRMKAGQPVRIVADVNPDNTVHGVVGSLAPATGAVFSVIPPENATGNFTKIVQRVPVRIQIDGGDLGPLGLRPGLSVSVTVDTKPR